VKRFKLGDSGDRGWFIGNFANAVLKTDLFEVCFQTNGKGTSYPKHYHKEITEIQLITRGCMILNGEEYCAGDIAVIEPGDVNEATYIEETDTVCVKTPSRPADKYIL
jgi:quercetin dioxygenase-like cupin family protein